MDNSVSDQILKEREAPSPPARSRRRQWMLMAVVPAALALAGYGTYRALAPAAPQNREGRQAGAGGLPPQSVGAATVGRDDIRVVLNALGTVTPLATVTVKTQINGQLVQIGFKEGQIVQKGDFLAQIDPRPYQIALEQAEGTLARDQALLRNALLDLQRYRTLLVRDNIARQQLDTQASLVQQYTGTVKTDQAAIDSAQLNLTYCRITAPVSGRVGLRQVDEGNYAQTSDARGIVVIMQMQPISVLFALPEDNLPEIARQPDSGTGLPVAAFNRANAYQVAAGHLETTDNQIDIATGTVKFRALFDNTDRSLFPNQFVNARLLVETLHGVLTMPSAALQQGEPGTFAYLVRLDGTVHVQPVTLGPADNGIVTVQSGLNEGDKVVTDGADRLREGARVVVLPAGGGDGRHSQGAGPPETERKPGANGQEHRPRPEGGRPTQP